MEAAPELFSGYLYAPYLLRAIHTLSAELVRDLSREQLVMLSMLLQSNKRCLIHATKKIQELRINIMYHHILIILNFAHRSETLFREILRREWPNFLHNRCLIKTAFKIEILLSALEVDSPEVEMLQTELTYLKNVAIEKDYELLTLVWSLENPNISTI